MEFCVSGAAQRGLCQWRVSATGIDDQLVRVLQGTNPRQPPVNFYFDNYTGLLVRIFASRTLRSAASHQVDYSDYREVAGVKIPLKWIMTWTNGQATSHSQRAGERAIDASRFARPAPAPAREVGWRTGVEFDIGKSRIAKSTILTSGNPKFELS